MDFYQLLGVNRDANDKQLKAAFKVAALSSHPDKVDDRDIQFMKFREAYDTLKDPKKRAEYDDMLARKEEHSKTVLSMSQTRKNLIDDLIKSERHAKQTDVLESYRKDLSDALQKFASKKKNSTIEEFFQDEEFILNTLDKIT